MPRLRRIDDFSYGNGHELIQVTQSTITAGPLSANHYVVAWGEFDFDSEERFIIGFSYSSKPGDDIDVMMKWGDWKAHFTLDNAYATFKKTISFIKENLGLDFEPAFAWILKKELDIDFIGV